MAQRFEVPSGAITGGIRGTVVGDDVTLIKVSEWVLDCPANQVDEIMTKLNNGEYSLLLPMVLVDKEYNNILKKETGEEAN